MATAIGFVRRGIDTTLVEISEDWASAGIGLTLLGPTLRALDTIGVADACAAAGFPQDHADFCNAQGERTAIIPFPKLAAERLPAAVCTTRPAFHRVLSNATIDVGVNVRLGLTVESLAQRNGAVDVELTDGARYSYDLVVAADGLHSRVRRLTFDDAPAPRFTGQAVWRTLVPRPPKLDVYHMFYGRKSKVGLVPVSNEGLHVFAVQNVADSSQPPRERLAELMRDLLDADSELIEHARSCIVDPAEVDYRPTEAMLVPATRSRGACRRRGAHDDAPPGVRGRHRRRGCDRSLRAGRFGSHARGRAGSLYGLPVRPLPPRRRERRNQRPSRRSRAAHEGELGRTGATDPTGASRRKESRRMTEAEPPQPTPQLNPDGIFRLDPIAGND